MKIQMPASLKEFREQWESVARDAERYRALRDSCNPSQPRSMLMPRVCTPMDFMCTYYPDGLDAAIDTAMQEPKP